MQSESSQLNINNTPNTKSSFKLIFDKEEDIITGKSRRVLGLFGNEVKNSNNISLEEMNNLKDFEVDLSEYYSEFGLKDMRLALFKMLRTTPRETVIQNIKNCMELAEYIRKDNKIYESILIELDIFRIALQTRDKEEGKGERDLTYFLLIELHKWKPRSVRALMKLLPIKYGSWLDIIRMIYLFEDESKNVDKKEKKEILKTVKYLMEYVITTLKTDKDSEKATLCAKWAPKEGGKDTILARRLAIMTFGDKEYIDAKKTYRDNPCTTNSKILDKQKRRIYKAWRHMLSDINQKIGTIECLECAGRWSEISIKNIPYRHLKLRIKAIQNKKIKTKNGGSDIRSRELDRIECSRNMENYLENFKKGKSSIKYSDTQMISGYDQLRDLITWVQQFNPSSHMDKMRNSLNKEHFDDVIHTLVNIGEGIFSQLEIINENNTSLSSKNDLELIELQKRVDSIVKMAN